MITAKVVEIIDNRTLAINAGRDSGVKIGMIFQILKDNGKEIKDPETGEILGRVKLPKIKVKITHADQKFSIGETYKYTEINKGGLNPLASVSSVLSPPKYVKKYETFEIDDDYKEEIDKEKSKIQIGDLAEQLDVLKDDGA